MDTKVSVATHSQAPPTDGHHLAGTSASAPPPAFVDQRRYANRPTTLIHEDSNVLNV